MSRVYYSPEQRAERERYYLLQINNPDRDPKYSRRQWVEALERLPPVFIPDGSTNLYCR